MDPHIHEDDGTKGGEKMNKKIAMSAISIVSALTIMGGATYATFFEDNVNQQNTFGAADLVFAINGQTGTSNNVFTTGNAGNMVPGQSNDQLLALTNSGTIPASSVKVTGFNKTGGTANFEDQITVTFFDDVNGNGNMDSGEASLGQALMSDPVWNNYTLPGVSIPAGGTPYNLGVLLTLNNDVPNSFQGASIIFNMNFQAVQ